ncbi:MAG: hypothetical protein IH628_11430 [Proteobacteria bacterium]|nr:hypothetical protein [Pseudomonadota bacterium]
MLPAMLNLIDDTMLDTARLRIGLWYSRFQFRKSKDALLEFTDAVRRAKRALVVLPRTPKDPASLQWVIRYLVDRFARGSLIIVARQEFSSWLAADKRYEILVYGDADVGPWFTPDVGLLRKLKKSTFDIAIDLNPEFDLFSAFVCRASLAPVRVGFVKDNADVFYNFQIQVGKGAGIAGAYRSLLRCMEMF